jgi:hypothetical protein
VLQRIAARLLTGAPGFLLGGFIDVVTVVAAARRARRDRLGQVT